MGANVLLLEGPKKTGKTTVARMLERKGFCYFKDNTFYSIKDRDEEFQKYVLENNLSILESFIDILPGVSNLIVDRHHITDFVYSSLYRNISSEEAMNNFIKHDNILSSKNGILIMMSDKKENIVKRDNRFSTSSPIYDECDSFEKMYEYSNMIKYKLCLSDSGFEKQLDEIIRKHFNM